MREHPFGKEAAVIGKVVRDAVYPVSIKTKMGVDRIVDMMSGEQLPRIC